jgi:hypothetical protein
MQLPFSLEDWLAAIRLLSFVSLSQIPAITAHAFANYRHPFKNPNAGAWLRQWVACFSQCFERQK